MDLMREALEQIRNGKTRFSAEQETPEELRSFQDLAAALKSASDSGYINAVFHVSGIRGTLGHIREVIVSGPLTHQGLHYLASAADTNHAKDSDIIQLKPNIYGIGIDLRAAYRWVKQKICK